MHWILKQHKNSKTTSEGVRNGISSLYYPINVEEYSHFVATFRTYYIYDLHAIILIF